MRLEPAALDHLGVLTDLHRSSFTPSWRAEDIAALLDGPGGYGLIALDEAGQPQGFVLARLVADEAEILTLAVAPGHRRRGLARGLVDAAAGLARARGAASLFLEVAADNGPAVGLYRAAGFGEVGRRRGYYARAHTPPADALVMRRDLNTGPASAYP